MAKKKRVSNSTYARMLDGFWKVDHALELALDDHFRMLVHVTTQESLHFKFVTLFSFVMCS